MTTTDEAQRAVLGSVVRRLVAFRGWSSPEKFDRSYRPGPAPVGGATIRRISDAEWTIPTDREDLTLTRLSGMLRLPVETLDLVYGCDVERLRSLDWKGETDVAQYVIETVEAVVSPPRARRASDRKRARG